MKQIFINLLAFGSLLSSVLVITSKNPVIAVIFLISVFVNAAGYLILLGIGFIGISYILIYIGAITVLFLFVIMMINIKLTDILESGSQYTKNIPLALSVSGLFLYELYNILPFTFWNGSDDILDLLLSLNDHIISIVYSTFSNPISFSGDSASAFSGVLGQSNTGVFYNFADLVLSIPNWADALDNFSTGKLPSRAEPSVIDPANVQLPLSEPSSPIAALAPPSY